VRSNILLARYIYSAPRKASFSYSIYPFSLLTCFAQTPWLSKPNYLVSEFSTPLMSDISLPSMGTMNSALSKISAFLRTLQELGRSCTLLRSARIDVVLASLSGDVSAIYLARCFERTDNECSYRL